MVEKDGQTAIDYYQTIPHVVEAHGHEYAFVVRADICMAWILNGDVDAILAVTKVCCNNHPKRVYRLANEDDVRRWTNGGGR